MQKDFLMARVLAIDFGKKRTGIAVTDELQIIASGLTTIHTIDLLSFLKEYTSKEEVALFLVGKPKQMNNTDSESEILILPFLQKLNRKHTYSDVEELAKKQEEIQFKFINSQTNFALLDTDLLTIKIWLEDKFNQCPNWIDAGCVGRGGNPGKHYYCGLGGSWLAFGGNGNLGKGYEL